MRSNVERRIDALRKYRVGLRKTIEQLRKPFGDHYDRKQKADTLQIVLNGTDREWNELQREVNTAAELRRPVTRAMRV